jgi:ABC-2 type transport system ATP-binding protein
MDDDYVIEVNNLVKSYSNVRVVDNVSFNVKRGTVFALLGPNGAGKTTIVEILSCLRSLTSGRVRILGYRLGDRGEEMQIKKHIGLMPQDFKALDKLTVKENLQLFAKMYDKHVNIDELLIKFDLKDYAHVRFEKLSGGLKQRLGLAVSIVNDPKLLFLDEPTTGLDPAARRQVWEIIRSLKGEGKTIILTSHYMDEVEYLADEVAVINKGSIIALGSTREIIDRFGSAKRILIRNGYSIIERIRREVTSNIVASGNDLLVYVNNDNNSSMVKSIIEIAVSNGYEFYFKNPSLEDAFLRLVGRLDEHGTLLK